MMRVDTLHHIETPEGVELSLRCAGPMARGLAYLVDMGIRSVVFFALMAMFAYLGGSSMGLTLLALFLLEWFYPMLFEVLWRGRTPGKRALGLVVVRDDGLPVDWGSSALRNLLRTADFLPAMFGAAYVSMLASKSFKRLGDFAAGTIVVYASTELAQSWIAKASTVQPHAPVQPLTLDEQRAVIAFASRARLLGPARADELAAVAAQTLDGRTHASASPTERVVAVATWLRESGRSASNAGDSA